MGQPVAVVEKPSRHPGVVRYEANRNLTGMAHERFRSVEEANGDRPAAVLARRLLETDRVESVHIYGNVITVDLRKGFDASGLAKVVEDLYVYYREGFVPPPLELSAEEAPASSSGSADEGGSGALSEAAKRVPAHLLERSRLAKERAKAKAAAG
jgi:hypothetical protein